MTPSVYTTRIKMCGFTRESDVDAAVAAGADAIGLVLYPPSKRYVDAQRAGQLARRLPAFVTPVLLFVNAQAHEIETAAEQGHIGRLKIHRHLAHTVAQKNLLLTLGMHLQLGSRQRPIAIVRRQGASPEHRHAA